jgi:hypothetical protein
MLSACKQERDAEGREVVSLGMDRNRARVVIFGAPVIVVLVMHIALELPLPVTLVVLAVLTALAAYVSFRLLGWMVKRAQLRVTLDTKAGRILVATPDGQSALRMADLAKAEFGSTISTFTRGTHTEETTVYRLEFVKKNGERMPATTAYTSAYSLAHQREMTTAINAALERRMA